MIKIGLTGSIASGKTTACKILSKNKYPLFIADDVVKKLYKRKDVKQKIAKFLNFNPKSDFNNILKKKILQNKNNLKRIEKIIHPLVRREMLFFLKKNQNKKISISEIPLLIENNLMRYFDAIILIKSIKRIRLKRFKSKGGSLKIFKLLNNKQLEDKKKIKLSDHIVVNNKSFYILKRNLLNIIKFYE